jgi:predicted NAD/FAD-binding protein
VVGSGISGLGAAYLLSRVHDVTLFERDDRLGGHTHTVSHATPDGPLALDTGFIVHNTRTYPLLVRLLDELGVKTRDSRMSFSVKCDRCGIEYCGTGLHRQPRIFTSLRHQRLLFDVARFLRRAPGTLHHVDERVTLADYLATERYSPAFRDHYLVPLVAAVWSKGAGSALEMPARYVLQFMDNHAMLGFRRLMWRTVEGGSREYVRAIVKHLGMSVRVRTPVTAVERHPHGAYLRLANGERHDVDAVVVATHADQALALLADPSEDERRLLGAFSYTSSETVLHTDSRLLPSPAARASWNFHTRDCQWPADRPTITYYLNSLQGLDGPVDYCVSLNQTSNIDPDRVIRTMTYEHPVYTVEAEQAQRELPQLNGRRHTAFAGAYHGYGFHEDGLAAAVRAAAAFGVNW